MALRQQVWVDRSVQGVLVGRVILYWICALLYVGIGSACFQYNQNPEWTLAKHAQVLFGQVWPWLPTAFILLPLAIYDVVRLSNLFAGPIYRLRQHFAALREDIACAPLVFREEDYWRDLSAPINDMQAEILRLRTGIIELQKAASKPAELTASSIRNPSLKIDAETLDDNDNVARLGTEDTVPPTSKPSLATETVTSEVVVGEQVASGPENSSPETSASVTSGSETSVVTSGPLTSEPATSEPVSELASIQQAATKAVIGEQEAIDATQIAPVAIAPLPVPAPVAGEAAIESSIATPAS